MLKNFLNNLNLKNVKKIFLYSIFIFFIFNSSFACQLLNVPIGSNVTSAAATFDFLDDYNQEAYGENSSAKYEEYAADFCDGSDLKETDLEVIIYQSKIAAINLINSDQENNNLVYVAGNLGIAGYDSELEEWKLISSSVVYGGEIVYSMEINEKFLFLGTSNGFCRINIKTGQIRNYNYPFIGQVNDLILDDNILWVGSNNGFIKFKWKIDI